MIEELPAEAIDAMPAGPEMDALLAERVMGHTEAEYDGDVWYSKAPGAEYAYRLLHYSTDIAAAWLVVEERMQRGFDLSIFASHENDALGSYYVAHLTISDRTYTAVSASPETMAASIGRAALKTTLDT